MEIENRLEEEYTYTREQDVPVFFEPGYVNIVADSLPYYFPNYLKERLKREHPDIPVVTREVPEETTENICAPYLKSIYRGGHYLNEMLIETLAYTILTGINDYIEIDSFYIKNFFEPFLNEYGRNDKTVELIQRMQVALLSGDFRSTNEFLDKNFKTFLIYFLSDIGNRIKDGKYQFNMERDDTETNVGMFSVSEMKIYIDPTRQNLLNSDKRMVNKLKSLLKLENLLLLTSSAKEDKELIEKYTTRIKETYADIARIGIHETLHYLSYDSKEQRCGFLFFNSNDYYKFTRTY